MRMSKFLLYVGPPFTFLFFLRNILQSPHKDPISINTIKLGRFSHKNCTVSCFDFQLDISHFRIQSEVKCSLCTDEIFIISLRNVQVLLLNSFSDGARWPELELHNAMITRKNEVFTIECVGRLVNDFSYINLRGGMEDCVLVNCNRLRVCKTVLLSLYHISYTIIGKYKNGNV